MDDIDFSLEIVGLTCIALIISCTCVALVRSIYSSNNFNDELLEELNNV